MIFVYPRGRGGGGWGEGGKTPILKMIRVLVRN